jgi:Zn-dependent M16 (insulinase) family peptidase
LSPLNEGLTIPAQVNYVGKGANIYDLGYELNGSVTVISNLLRTTWLWEKIRVQGGAYGAGCSLNQYSGIFSYFSYRDPNLKDTLTVYDQTADYLRNLNLHEDELLKSIIGAIGEVDAYQLPDAKGYTSLMRHLLGVTDESRQKYRDEILTTKVSDFQAFAGALDKVKDAGTVAILGSAEDVNNANEDGWLTVSKVL